MVIVFAIFTIGVLALVAYAMAFGVTGVALAVIIGVAMTWGSYWKSDVIALRMSRAVEALSRTIANGLTSLPDLAGEPSSD